MSATASLELLMPSFGPFLQEQEPSVDDVVKEKTRRQLLRRRRICTTDKGRHIFRWKIVSVTET